MSDLKTSQKTALERHAQTIIAGIGLSLILWVGKSVNEQSIKLIQVEERMMSMQNQVQMLSEFARQPRFTKEDFRSEMRVYENRLDFMEQIIDAHQKELVEKNTNFENVRMRLQKLETKLEK